MTKRTREEDVPKSPDRVGFSAENIKDPRFTQKRHGRPMSQADATETMANGEEDSGTRKRCFALALGQSPALKPLTNLNLNLNL